MCSIFAVVLAVGSIALYLMLRRRKRRKEPVPEQNLHEEELSRKPLSKSPSSDLGLTVIPKSDIKKLNQIGKGESGDVWKGDWLGNIVVSLSFRKKNPPDTIQ